MSKTGNWLIEHIEMLADKTGYPFGELIAIYLDTVTESNEQDWHDDPYEVFEARVLSLPPTQTPRGSTAGGWKNEGSRQRKGDRQPHACASRELDEEFANPMTSRLTVGPSYCITFPPDETTKIRKHNHDILYTSLSIRWGIRLGNRGNAPAYAHRRAGSIPHDDL